MTKPVDGAEALIMRLAELQYHADGFTDMAKRGVLTEPAPWIAEALTSEHSGDCTKQPWSCMRCHAEDAMDAARWVYPRHSAALVADARLAGVKEGLEMAAKVADDFDSDGWMGAADAAEAIAIAISAIPVKADH